MSWDYAWKLGPKGGTLIDLDDYCSFVRLAGGGEPIAHKRGQNPVSPYRHGAWAVAHKFLSPMLIPLEVSYRYTNSSGAVTHGDGAAGHVYENKATVEQALFGLKGLATLRRTVPDLGTVEAYVEPASPSVQSQNRHTYMYLLSVPEGTWRSTTQTTDSSSPIGNAGNAPVWDAVVDIDTSASGTDVVVTMTADGATISIDGATPTGGVRVDFGTGLVTELSGGTDYGENVSFGKPYGVVLEPGDNAFTTSGSPSEVTFKFYPRFR